MPTDPPPTYRYAFKIEYDGGPFSGWQRQKGPRSIQQELEGAIACVTGQTVTCSAAGRTDQGVHAQGQVVHCDLARMWDPDVLRRGLNHTLVPRGISILQATQVHQHFHARFSALWRSYTYLILNQPSPSPLWAGRAFWVSKPLDLGAMRQAASLLVGTQDFSSFRHRDCQAQTPIKTLTSCHIHPLSDSFGPIATGSLGQRLIQICFQAPSFLHRQVRMMVGALVFVGQGRWDLPHFEKVLRGKKTLASATTAPAQGLVLTGVGYGHDPFAPGPFPPDSFVSTP